MANSVSDQCPQEVITGTLNVILEARHFIGTPFDCEITRFEKADAPLTKLIHQKRRRNLLERFLALQDGSKALHSACQYLGCTVFLKY